MSNEYWKKRGEDLPHYEPTHKTQNKNLDDVLNSIPGMPPQPNQQQNNPQSQGGWKDIDAGHMFNQMMQKNLHQSQQQEAPQQQANVVMLREGHNSFRQLEIQVPADVSLATNAGALNGVSGREFEFKGIRQFYILENQHETIDLSKLDHSKLINLAVVSAPFIGTILVPESAVIRQQNKGTQLLKG